MRTNTITRDPEVVHPERAQVQQHDGEAGRHGGQRRARDEQQERRRVARLLARDPDLQALAVSRSGR
ncbi:hypothetical protein [Saccharopolyspora sp. CA-218241]|uniref:hypothetical protein n=1 Tax=Saccharopolyspora sp. CA-218241 TaxID=3240027 RepID=UPI003D999B84